MSVQELLQLPENSRCADCGQAEPVWASCAIGVFVCLECSGVHRNPKIGKVKSIQLDYMEQDFVQFLQSHGNRKAREEYEAFVPPYYYRPTEKDFKVLREQWIRAKYERQEFRSGEQCRYAVDFKEGVLWKKGRNNGQFLERLFKFSKSDGLLTYCTNDKEIVTWYNVLRAARFHYLKKTFPNTPEAELIPKITRNYTKSGYMEKTGPTHRERFKKRWFNLDSEERKLLYYKDPLDPYEQGGIFIGSCEAGYCVTEGLPKGMKGNKWAAGIIIQTPQREFILTCESSREQKDWLQVLQAITARPMSAYDTGGRALDIIL